ncbi:MAG: peptidase U32 family protein [archaeon]
MVSKKFELLVGVGSWPALIAAVKNGADSVYFGLKELNMRAFAKNFELKDLKKIVSYCHENKVKAFLTLNSLVFESDLSKVDRILKNAGNAGIDAVIVSDFGVLSLAKNYGLEVHLSTQTSTSNSVACKLVKKLGVKRVILARELNLNEIKKLEKNTSVELECFVHGSMCISVSGRCFLSHEIFGLSANEGKCVQPCRRTFMVEDPEKELIVQPKAIFSPKDLCLIEELDTLVKGGITKFKIEGRSKPATYVAVTTKAYRTALNAIREGTYNKKLKEQLLGELKTVYNRGFSKGFYFKEPSTREFVESPGSKQSRKRKVVGEVTNYFKNAGAAEIKLNESLKLGEEIIIEGKTTFLTLKVDSMQVNGKNVKKVGKGRKVGVLVKERVRPGDKVFKWI